MNKLLFLRSSSIEILTPEKRPRHRSRSPCGPGRQQPLLTKARSPGELRELRAVREEVGRVRGQQGGHSEQAVQRAVVEGVAGGPGCGQHLGSPVRQAVVHSRLAPRSLVLPPALQVCSDKH